MRHKSWIPLALFLGSALLSAWLSPALWLGVSRASSSPLESALPGGMNGRTWLRTGEALEVKVGVAPGVHDIQWILDGRMVGKDPDLHLEHLRNGDHILSLTYRDTQDRLYAATSLVRILEPGPYMVQAASVQAAISLPLLDEEFELFLPLTQR